MKSLLIMIFSVNLMACGTEETTTTTTTTTGTVTSTKKLPDVPKFLTVPDVSMKSAQNCTKTDCSSKFSSPMTCSAAYVVMQIVSKGTLYQVGAIHVELTKGQITTVEFDIDNMQSEKTTYSDQRRTIVSCPEV